MGTAPVRRRRFLFGGFVLAAAFALVVATPFAGDFLVVEDPLEKADAIVVMSSPRVERTYEAAFLFREGFAPVVYITNPDDRYQEAMARFVGVTVPRYVDLQRDVLEDLGVRREAIKVLERRTYFTREEAEALAGVALRNRWKAVIVVTTGYHTRRTRVVLRSVAAGRFRVIVRKSRVEELEPRRWWRVRNDWPVVIVEYLRLFGLAD